MKTGLLLLAGLGIGAYGLYLNSKRKKASQMGLIVAKNGPVPSKPEIMPDVVLQSFRADQKAIFPNGEFRQIPWPASINQSFVTS